MSLQFFANSLVKLGRLLTRLAYHTCVIDTKTDDNDGTLMPGVVLCLLQKYSLPLYA